MYGHTINIFQKLLRGLRLQSSSCHGHNITYLVWFKIQHLQFIFKFNW